MSAPLEKVTTCVVHPSTNGRDILLFEHPKSGIQIPAVTVEPGESPPDAVLRTSR